VLHAQLSASPDRIPAHAPVTSRPQTLPFGELTWENFERLCYRLASKADRVEHVARYGRSGQSQEGIDLFARLPNGKYEVWQAKRYQAITATELTSIVRTFNEGAWSTKTDTLILATQASLADTKMQDSLETEAAALKQHGITFLPRGGEELSEALREHPDLIDDFFGREWVKAFLGPQAADALGSRLDGGEFARVREQLRKYYDIHFRSLDIGVALPLLSDDPPKAPPPSLLARFAVPDVLVRSTLDEQQPSTPAPMTPNAPVLSAGSTHANTPDGAERFAAPRRRDYLRRTPLANWLTQGVKFTIVGEPGSGKSTLLRCVALEMLEARGALPPVSRRWSGRLPIHLSFSRWSRLSARLERAASFQELVAETLQTGLTADLAGLLNRAIDERRIVLLLDGLDEWTDEQAARTTLQQVLTFVETHEIPTLATARPRGLSTIGVIPSSWQSATLAPLSEDQQRSLAEGWFARGLGLASDGNPGDELRAPLDARLDRFFADLARDRRLATLASNALLLVGLTALAIRQIALPRNRVHALQSLVELLLETHPRQRATAAGDTHDRFLHIPDADHRRAALAYLAFVTRSATGGNAYDLKEAKRVIRQYLSDPETYAYPLERAQQAANELLAVNAETVGLLAERAPGEIAFAHAVFEEYLAAEYLQSWPLLPILEFVQSHAGETLWRHVLANFVALLQRATEVETVAAAIERAHATEGNLERAVNLDLLLADIAFNSSRKPAATAKRLANAALQVIESGNWLLTRREVLKSALANLGEDTSAPVDARVPFWAPRRQRYSSSVFAVFARWQKAPDLLEVLLKGLNDELPSNQHSAGAALAARYTGDPGVEAALRQRLRKTLDMSVAAAALDSLTNGWPSATDLVNLQEEAFASLSPALRFVGSRGRAISGRADLTDRDAIAELLTRDRVLDFEQRAEAREMLSRHWRDDSEVIAKAFASLHPSGGYDADLLEYDTAVSYLLSCSASNTTIAEWIREELKKAHPFGLSHHWDLIIPFAHEHPDIQQSVGRYITSEKQGHRLYEFQNLLIHFRSDALRDYLIEVARKTQGFGEFWAVQPLLRGWGRSDPIVNSFLDEIAQWDDDRLNDLGSLLPEIVPDPLVCRSQLLSLARNAKHPRFDLIARGLASLGCGASDLEVVDTLLACVGQGAPAFDPGNTLIKHFSAHPRVREYAKTSLEQHDAPLEALAEAYENDRDIRPLVLRCMNSLPGPLRGDLAEIAVVEASSRPAFWELLKNYDAEEDGELKITGSIYYHRELVRISTADLQDDPQRLRDALEAVGPDLEERRAAAFAGMLLERRLDEVAAMLGDEPDTSWLISTGSGFSEESERLAALICENWNALVETFGSTLLTHFGRHRPDERVAWNTLAPHVHSSEAARTDFLQHCSSTSSILGLRSLLALAQEQPSSQLLLKHCRRALNHSEVGGYPQGSPWDVSRIGFEAGYLLRDHFRDSTEVLEFLRQTFTEHPKRVQLIALTLFQPGDPLLDRIQLTPKEIWEQHADRVVAMHVASARSQVQDFTEFLLDMINCSAAADMWRFQDITNRAVLARLRRDEEVTQGLRDVLMRTPTASELASLPRYLLAAGALDTALREYCSSRLQEESQRALPRAGYDAIENQVRAISQSLLDVLAPSFST